MTPTELIDIDLWDRAMWRATGFGAKDDDPPVLALVYKAGGAAKQLFRRLRAKLGAEDSQGFLRVSVVMDDRRDPPDGYFVQVGPSERLIAAARAEGQIDWGNFLVLTRVNEMNVTRQTAMHMGVFREAYARHGRFNLVPAIIRPTGEVKPFSDLGIMLEQVHFRSASEISANTDPDWCLLSKAGGPPRPHGPSFN